MGNKNTHVASVVDQTNKRVRFGVSKHANNGDVNDVNEEEFNRLKLEELANEKLSDFEENDLLCEQV
uniref:Uncharacterized protein n=1 Tax=Tanacetum cinerariifolium TaxID=118510 RepID=A0A699JX50_TANCI|nr:hypothetical protein [Tanacetum cinerariifolium]